MMEAEKIEAAARHIAKMGKCGAIVTENGSTRVVLCCDETLTISRYRREDCDCLAVAQAMAELGTLPASERVTGGSDRE